MSKAQGSCAGIVDINCSQPMLIILLAMHIILIILIDSVCIIRYNYPR